MTPEIKAIEYEINKLRLKRVALVSDYLATIAVAQIGELITWRKGQYKGRVIGFIERYESADYLAVRIKKDGTDGAKVTVSHYDSPVKFITGA